MTTIEDLRAAVVSMLQAASDDAHHARMGGDHEQAALVDVERDTLLRVLMYIDMDPGEA